MSQVPGMRLCSSPFCVDETSPDGQPGSFFPSLLFFLLKETFGSGSVDASLESFALSVQFSLLAASNFEILCWA